MTTQGKYVYDYPRAGITVDIVLVDVIEGAESILLIERGGAPYAGSWALPGGYMEIDESLVDCARRELAEETGVTASELQLVGVYDALDRDPRGRTLTVAYLGTGVEGELSAGDDAARASWFRTDELPPLAFDHDTIVADALALKG